MGSGITCPTPTNFPQLADQALLLNFVAGARDLLMRSTTKQLGTGFSIQSRSASTFEARGMHAGQVQQYFSIGCLRDLVKWTIKQMKPV